MTYPHFKGILPTWDTRATYSPVITGIGVYGLSHDYGTTATGFTLDFTLGHFQSVTLTGTDHMAAYTPPGIVQIILRVTQGGAGGFYLVPDGIAISTPGDAGFSSLFSTDPGMIDLIELTYTGNGTTWLARNICAEANPVS